MKLQATFKVRIWFLSLLGWVEAQELEHHMSLLRARELNILTVGVTTLPFSYEGPKRMKSS